jgi:hypothetical protein
MPQTDAQLSPVHGPDNTSLGGDRQSEDFFVAITNFRCLNAFQPFLCSLSLLLGEVLFRESSRAGRAHCVACDRLRLPQLESSRSLTHPAHVLALTRSSTDAEFHLGPEYRHLL